jgi:hypothetical protein
LTFLIDADVLLIDYRYKRDPSYIRNRQALERLHQDGHEVGITSHALLEVIGVVSFMTPVAKIAALPNDLIGWYGLKVFPDPAGYPNYAEATIDDVVSQMATKMSLGDAVQAVQIQKFAPHADALLTWNAKHFKGKLVISALTPEEWLKNQAPPAPSTP